ncbi:MAG: DUF4157 domain-containing protein, partial [Synechococcales bacterium]|nr:DUF4157 domain-containing protein [Synechococcales bacterium]
MGHTSQQPTFDRTSSRQPTAHFGGRAFVVPTLETVANETLEPQARSHSGVDLLNINPFAGANYSAPVQPKREAPAGPEETAEEPVETLQARSQDSFPPAEPNDPPPIQPKLTIGQPNDQYEQEADRVAAQVMGMAPPATPTLQRQTAAEESEDLPPQVDLQPKSLATTITPLVQRQTVENEEALQAKCSACEQEEKVQRSTDGAVRSQSDLESRLNTSKGGGSPLPDEVRSFMEPRFGADFSGVRVHTGGDAVQMNREVGAQAFTHGSHVYYGSGKGPGNDELTAHELTHVVQQTGRMDRKLDDESQAQKSNLPTLDTTAKQPEIPTETTNALPNTAHLNSVSNPEPAHPSAQSNLPEVTESTLPNQGGTVGNQASAAIGDIGNIANGKSGETELSNSSATGEGADKLAANLHADAQQSDNLPQSIPGTSGNPAYLNPEGITDELPLESPGIPDPALPESPDLAQATQQIMQRSEAEKAVLSQAAEAQRNTLMQQAEVTAKTIEATAQSKIQAIITDLESKKAGVKQTINTTKASIKAQIANQKMLAQAEGTKSLGALRKEVETKRKAAVDASETEAKQIEQTGQTEAKRVMTSSTESSARVHAIANQKASSSSSKPEVRSTVRQAVGQTATDVTGKMQQRSQDLAKNAQEASQKTAQGLRDAGKQLVSGIGTNTAQVEKAIQDGTNATVNQIMNQEIQSQQKLDALQVQALTSLEKLKASSIADLKQSGQMAAAAARKTGQTSATQINKAKTASLQQLDKGVNQVVGQLNQVPTGRKVNKKAVDQVVQEVGSKLQQANAQLGAMISEQAASSQNSLNQLGVSLPGHLDSKQQKVTAEANKATTGLSSGLTEVPSHISQASQQAISENKNANQQAIQQFGDGLQQQIDQAKQGWNQEKEKVGNDIRGKIDEGVKSNKDV